MTEHRPLLLSSSPPAVIMSPPRLVSSHPPCLVREFLSNFCRFLPRQQGEAAKSGERHGEERVREGTLSSSQSYKAISVPVKPCAVCPPHPLSSYQSVYSAWHCFLSPHFQRETQGAESDSLRSLEDSGSS